MREYRHRSSRSIEYGYDEQITFSPIRTITVGSGFTPDLLSFYHLIKVLAGLRCYASFTAGGDFHPALRNHKIVLRNYVIPATQTMQVIPLAKGI